MKFCSLCGSDRIEHKIPEGDNRIRVVCPVCAAIFYENPKIVVGCLPIHTDGRLLLCKRAIEPRRGYWTFPCGFMENGETAEQGAARETLEEANARVKITALHSLYSLPHIHQVYMVYLGDLLDLDFFPGEESEVVELVDAKDIPWKDLAFPSIHFTLEKYLEDVAKNRHTFVHQGSYDKRR